MEKNNKLYLVAYIGMYTKSCAIYTQYDGEHSHYLFKTKKEAKQKFREWVKECKEYYRKERKVDFDVFQNLKDWLFSLRTEEDFVDIYIQEIKPDGVFTHTVL